MSRVVLDASALLVLLNNEPGAEKLTPELLSDAVMSTVNLAEVQTKLVREGVPPKEAWEDALTLITQAIPFTGEQAELAGNLVKQTQHFGLSLGDRACLALGIAIKAPVYTTDRSWKSLKLKVPIHVIR